ncbi:acylphosphatase [Xanthobacter sp. V4C-4]|uniref:acylphosphatase n=1 Tax=Xanthobacter cornucopiae TaxID=3119924 RepID=UPI003727F5D2
MRVVHITLRGRVQGVGYRAWCAHEARARGLRGWVRNRVSGAVELVAAGDEALVAALVDACRAGPPGARVDDLLLHDAAETALATAGAGGSERDRAAFVILDTL